MNLSVQDLRDTIRDEGLIAGVEKMDEALSNAFGKGTAEYQINLRRILGSVEAMKAYETLIGDPELYAQIVEDVKNSTGALDEAYAAMRHGTTELLNNLKGLGAELGEGLLPTVDRFSRKIGELTMYLNENEGAARFLTNFLFKGLTPALLGVGVALKGVSIAAKIATAGMRSFWISTGVGAAFVALGLVISNWNKISEAIGRAASEFRAFFGDVQEREKWRAFDKLTEDVENLDEAMADLTESEIFSVLGIGWAYG